MFEWFVDRCELHHLRKVSRLEFNTYFFRSRQSYAMHITLLTLHRYNRCLRQHERSIEWKCDEGKVVEKLAMKYASRHLRL